MTLYKNGMWRNVSYSFLSNGQNVKDFIINILSLKRTLNLTFKCLFTVFEANNADSGDLVIPHLYCVSLRGLQQTFVCSLISVGVNRLVH